MCQEFKGLLGCPELGSLVRMGSLANRGFQVVKGNKDYRGYPDPQASQGSENQASRDPKETGVLGVFLELLGREGKRDQ